MTSRFSLLDSNFNITCVILNVFKRGVIVKFCIQDVCDTIQFVAHHFPMRPVWHIPYNALFNVHIRNTQFIADVLHKFCVYFAPKCSIHLDYVFCCIDEKRRRVHPLIVRTVTLR